MAYGKKGFILYCDQIHSFEHLDDDEAGRLIKHIFRYVNDQNPEPVDKITKISFEPIKHQLKRDLKEWEATRYERSESGKAGGLKSGETRRKQAEAKRSTASKNEANEAVTDTVKVTDTVTDIVSEEQKKFRIEDCLRISLNDPRWVKANKATEVEILNFNDYLEKLGKYDFNPLDYKKYFATIKGKYPDLLKRKYTIEEFRAMAIEQDKINNNGKLSV